MYYEFFYGYELCSQILAGTLVILGTWIRKEMDKPDGVWDTTAEDTMFELLKIIHPMFRASSALERGEFRSKGGGKKTTHFSGSEQNVDLILRTITCANQLSIY